MAIEPIKLVFLNIERGKHAATLPFIQEEAPDVLCLAEVCQQDVPRIVESYGAVDSQFAPMGTHPGDNGEPVMMGVLIASRLPFIGKPGRHYYLGSLDNARRDGSLGAKQPPNRVLLCCTVHKDDVPFTLCTTHFIKTDDGSVDDAQRRAMRNLLVALRQHRELAFCADLNTPRGYGLWEEVQTAGYTDNIPQIYKTSLDVNFHRAGKTPRRHEIEDKVVDCLFTTPCYRVLEDIRLQFGVSDHAAIVAHIERIN